MNLINLDSKNAPPPASAPAKDFLKRQKEEERKVQQAQQQ
jgi:hypothetical protein